jgi:hypothetical protein
MSWFSQPTSYVQPLARTTGTYETVINSASREHDREEYPKVESTVRRVAAVYFA